jgi:hypothetical protein
MGREMTLQLSWPLCICWRAMQRSPEAGDG